MNVIQKPDEAVKEGFVQLRRKNTRMHRGVAELKRKSTVVKESFDNIKQRGSQLQRRLTFSRRMSSLFSQIKSSSMQAIQAGVSRRSPLDTSNQ